MKISSISFVVSSCFPISIYAAALEKSASSVLGFLESGHYAEIAFAQVNANVSGQVEHQEFIQQLGINDFSTGNLAKTTNIFNATLKFQLDPHLSLGFIFDQPYGVDVDYNYSPSMGDIQFAIEAAKIKFKSKNLSTLIGYQPTPHWNIFTGMSYQTFSGDLKISGQKYLDFNGYHSHFKQDQAIGWRAGISYQIPDYAFQTTLSYRSKIKHTLETSESIALPFSTAHDTKIETPQSVSFDFQTGLPQQNLFYGSIRWVNWQAFEIQPPKFAAVIQAYAAYLPEIANFKMIDYSNDQWSTKLGLAHQWHPNWFTSIELLWDSGTGNTASTLNPTDGYKGIGMGAMYKYNKHLSLASGVYYLKFFQSKVGTSDFAGTQISGLSSVNKNDAWVSGLKVGYHF